MLTFVGLGLYDERSVTLEGRDAIRAADRVFTERYTSLLAGTTIPDLETFHGVDIEVRDRAGVERDPDDVLAAAETDDVAFLVGGDPMISTTHVDLRLRAHERTIPTRIVHGTTAQTAASSLTGLQNYRFGKATTVPFPGEYSIDGVPESVVATIERNRDRGLHTLCYLDIDAEEERCLSADSAAGALVHASEDVLGVAIARAGSESPVVAAHRLSVLADRSFGEPLHLLVVPGRLHPLEADALQAFADAPSDLLGVE